MRLALSLCCAVCAASSGAPLSARDALSASSRHAGVSSARLVATLLATGAVSNRAEAASTSLSDSAYTTLGDMRMCRVLNGMWQVSGAHGYVPNKVDSVNAMTKCAFEGFTTFDLADIYGPAEEYVGEFSSGPISSKLSADSQFFTKWVPRPEEVNQKIADAAIDRSLRRMKKEQIDLLQFHWWDYENKYYFDAMAALMHMHDSTTPKIRNIGLTNFDTEHMLGLIDQDAPIVSNQVSFSILDSRPLRDMVPACADKKVKLLCYGSLLGGFLSDKWLGKPEPSIDALTNVSLRKYLPWIYYWGGWEMFQTLLTTLQAIANKHSVSLSNVAAKWVLQQRAVGGVIVGIRLGLSDHVSDNKRLFSFELDAEDMAHIAEVTRRSKDLRSVFGDCGGEYRRRA